MPMLRSDEEGVDGQPSVADGVEGEAGDVVVDERHERVLPLPRAIGEDLVAPPGHFDELSEPSLDRVERCLDGLAVPELQPGAARAVGTDGMAGPPDRRDLVLE